MWDLLGNRFALVTQHASQACPFRTPLRSEAFLHLLSPLSYCFENRLFPKLFCMKWLYSTVYRVKPFAPIAVSG